MNRLKKGFRQLLNTKLIMRTKFEKEEYWLLLIMVIYTAIFSFFTIQRMYALSASAWDLGNYNQAIFTTVFKGKLFYYTPDLPANPSGSLFGVHFSPSLAALFPFYAIFPHVETLLVLQSLFLGAGCLPVYWLARNFLGSKKWGLVFALVYLLNSALWGINWFDFHPEALIPISMLLVIYSFYKQSWFKFAVFSVFSLGIMEQVPVLMIFLGIFFTYESKNYLFKQRRTIQNRNALVASVFLLFVSAIWLFGSTKVIQYLSPESPLHFGTVTSWEILGAPNFLQIPVAILTNPLGAINALNFDFASKALYLISILGGFGFFSFFSPITLILAIPNLAVGLLSNNPVYYSLGVQYPAFILPFIAFASIKGAANLRLLKVNLTFKGSKVKLRIKPRKEYLLFFSIAFLVLSNPFLSLNVATFPYTAYGVPSISPRDKSAILLVGMVPADASVLVPQHIFPLVSSRLDAFTPPTSAFMPPYTSFINKLEVLIEKSEYVILDLSSQGAVDAMILSRISGRYGVIASLEGFVLLKKGYVGDLQSFKPYDIVFDYRDLIIKSGKVVSDQDSISGFVLQSDSTNSSIVDLWWGPFVRLPPGNYRVTYRIKAGTTDMENLAVLTANVFKYKVFLNLYGSLSDGYLTDFSYLVSEKKVLQEIFVKGTSVEPDEYVNFSTIFTADVFGAYEFPGMNIMSNASLSLDRIEIHQIESFSSITPIDLQFGNFSSVIYDSEHISKVFTLMNLIPQHASVVIQNNLYALYSNLENAYFLPPIVDAAEILAFIKSIQHEVDFVLFDWNVDLVTASKALSQAHLLDDFGVYAWDDGKILLKHGYEGAPLIL